MEKEKRDTCVALFMALALTALPWGVYVAGALLEADLGRYGLQPMCKAGLVGALLMPLLHANVDHLISNTPPLFLLTFGLFLFYRRTAWRILLVLWLVTGGMTWIMGRPGSVHVGASGLVYALAAFHFTSGLIKKVPRQMAFALLVAFLYGSFVWAFFPSLYRYTDISYEGHLSGLLTGLAFAFYFRSDGLQPPPDPFPPDDDMATNGDGYFLDDGQILPSCQNQQDIDVTR